MVLQLVRTYIQYTHSLTGQQIIANIHIVGQPVGWCITDKEDYDVIKLFLDMIKSQSPDSQVSVIMTDDGELIDAYPMKNTLQQTIYIVLSHICMCNSINVSFYLKKQCIHKVK